MDCILLILTTLVAIFIVKIVLLVTKPNKNLPPSPNICFPIIGHLHLLKKPLLHRTLSHLSHSLGPVFSLRLGSRLAVIISSPTAAEECFLTKNDIVLANRPRFIMGKYVAYDYTSMVTAPYGDHWRNLRRITALEVFSTNRLNASAEIRHDEVKMLLQKLHDLSVERPAKVELRQLLTGLTLNVIMRMMTGKRFFEEDDGGKAGISLEFRELVAEILELSAADNPADFLPALRWFDYKGLVKRAKRIGERMDSLLQGFLDEHRANKDRLEFKNTMIAHLLDSQEKEPHNYSDQTIKGLILMMVVGGTDTSALTVEWAMSNLLNHPQILETTRQNIDTQMETSSSRRLLKEEDLVNMNYLKNVVSETLRLYPVAPLMVPHVPSSDCVIGGFNVPRDTIVLVNLWAIHRDPSVWDDPTSFKPERFEGSDQFGHYNGKMMPFGLGRRACPGLSLANRVVGLLLGSMIQCFEWESGSGGQVDMTEGPGLSLPKAEPLVVTCRTREMASELLFFGSEPSNKNV
ncbi:cytochrome P450-like protein [Arabidopsis thaliana]|jgi:cytochrome P450|uniref:Cytochrome P450, family 81, subfamily H, polypeptide 1 n=2 Tax=Arabidopsis thaliana TaxID=3702 RepID=Q9SW67_ARATH|nr:cytochrome P450, family 81, subfamily H, polypeptide 1 [Arabidopsis thaliana]AEE86780.1 cytochrome P450, family 81, subfamily H, polypeptide 1 [Arabidopsis thaliana]CAB16771.1 cytochrome P450-like protein [Arabidopsis thaliana]CAB80397.1 cytochrome P450-like protein [Arabidopsis thaliana]|eukprot:NP_568024.2 cytochrome P450, family 81, subfamily H, polypeptide 1 [Arabidopsis thaliana]